MPDTRRSDESDDSADVEWLTAQEREVWLRLLALTIRLPSALDAQLQRDSGLTLFEYTVLAALSEQPTRTLRMSELATLAQGSQSRLSHVATKLERAGLITRQTNPTNGRYIDAILTDAGMTRIRAVAPQHVDIVRRLIFDGLRADQLGPLAEAAETILTRIDPDPSPRPWTGFQL